MTEQLTAKQVHFLDQFTATVNEILDMAIQEMRDRATNDDHTTMIIAEKLQAACAEDEQTRDRIAIGFIYALRRLANEPR